MKSILGTEAVREMIDDLPAAIGTAAAVALFLLFWIVVL